MIASNQSIDIRGAILGPILAAFIGYAVFGPVGAAIGFFGAIGLLLLLVFGVFAQVMKQTPRAPEPTVSCTNCHSIVPASASRCPHCGRSPQA